MVLSHILGVFSTSTSLKPSNICFKWILVLNSDYAHLLFLDTPSKVSCAELLHDDLAILTLIHIHLSVSEYLKLFGTFQSFEAEVIE